MVALASSPWRPRRQSRVNTLNSISAVFSQLAGFGGVVKLQAFHDTSGLGGGKGLVKGSHAVDVQVVRDDTDDWRVRVGYVHQASHLAGEVLHGAPLRDGHVGPAGPGIAGQEDVAGATTILVVLAPRSARLWRQRLSHISLQLKGVVEVWLGSEGIVVHPRASEPGQRFILPSQWSGLPGKDDRHCKETVTVQVPVGEVQRRSPDVYELVAGGVARSPWIRRANIWKPWVSGRPWKSLTTPWTPRPTSHCPITRCWPNFWASKLPPEAKLPHHSDQAGPSLLLEDSGAIRLRLPALHRRATGQSGLRRRAANVLLWGPPSVGRTHLALKAIENGYGAYFVRAYDQMCGFSGSLGRRFSRTAGHPGSGVV